MKIATALEMREIDKRAIEEYAIPGVVLMENAGSAVVQEIEQTLGRLTGKKVCIFCGKGNNGGDGFVIARHLHNQGVKVKVFLVAAKDKMQGDALIHLTILEKIGLDIMEVSGDRDWDKVKIAITFADCLVDAMLGTGFKGQLQGILAEVAEMMNKSGKIVFAVDIPSGVDADTGQAQGICVQATHTVTFALPKLGLLLYPGAACAGKVIVADIGMPIALLAKNIKQNLLRTQEVRDMLVHRRPDAHKGTAGRALVIAGSKGLTGAAALTSQAALRTGAGLVTLGVGESLHDIMEVKLTEVMTRPLAECIPGAIASSAVAEILTMSANAGVVAIGPGLGRQADTMEMVRKVVEVVEKPLVIDADALFALIGHTDLLPKAKALPVLTPHPGELAKLVGLAPNEINEDRVYITRQAAVEWESIVILKGALTVVAFPDGEVYINTTGNEGMATGGTGDVLTGVIAGLIAQGMSSHAAALAGVYLHGLAGNIAASAGKIGLTAGDLLKVLPAARVGIESKDAEFIA